MDQEGRPPTQKSISTRKNVISHFILIVIDTIGGKVSRIVAELRKSCNRVDRPRYFNIQLQGLIKDKFHTSNVIISKPFHGSCLYQVVMSMCFIIMSVMDGIEAIRIVQARDTFPFVLSKIDKSLSGKKVLVVEDDGLLQRIATAVLSRLGAITEISANGQEALEIIYKGFEDRMTSGTSHSLPFDYIFMDCQMPVMDGIEATRRIREEESKYGVHIPIFVVSAHTDGPEIQEALKVFEDQG